MSGNKYADLPDIDTAPDVYETEDVFPSASEAKGDSSDDEVAIPSRPTVKPTGREDIDSTSLLSTEVASQKFRKAEKRRERARAHYAYPPSPTSPGSPTGFSATSAQRPVPLSYRLRSLQNELSTLESELADPTNPLLHKDADGESVDAGELLRGLVDVRGRLEKIKKGNEGRGKLVNVVLGHGLDAEKEGGHREESRSDENKPDKLQGVGVEKPSVRSIVDMDRRVGELEKLIGSSSASLDEVSPLPQPLLPSITRLNAQLTLLTQPRHIDSISRRLKLLLSDLDRASTQHHKRHPSQPSGPQASPLQEQLLPMVSRLSSSMPHIPHILTRLRTLSALHASAGEFQNTLASLEEEQRKVRDALTELSQAVDTVEKNLDENQTLVRGNVAGLESRVDSLVARLEELGHDEE